MSQFIEEFSPLSSEKMDISEATTSQSSPDEIDMKLGGSNGIKDLKLTSQLKSVVSHPLMSPKLPVIEVDENQDSPTGKKKTTTSFLFNNLTTKHETTQQSLKKQSRLEKVEAAKEDSLDESDSEPDLSQYQTRLEPSFQSVALVSNLSSNLLRTKSNSFNNIESCSSKNGGGMETNESDNNSSLESLSNRSFDALDGLENQRVFLSRSSSSASLVEEGPRKCVEPIPEYPAEEEARNLRSWQKVTLSDGRTREIDMKVIEPYKRVLSHGGYLAGGGQNAIVIFSACFLPDRSRTDYHYVMDSLFLYVLKTLEQLVTDDYVILYLHGGSCRNNVPSFPWLKKCYQLLDRRLRKSLKNLYMVHPTFWLKSVVWMSRPFISSKFWRKLVYVKNLEELQGLVPNLEKASLPDKVKVYDTNFCK